MKKITRRILSFLMAAVMVTSTAALAVSAEEQPSVSNPVYYHFLVDVTITDKYGRVNSEDYPNYKLLFFINKDNYEKWLSTQYDKKTYYLADPDSDSIGAHHVYVLNQEFTKEPTMSYYWVIMPMEEIYKINMYRNNLQEYSRNTGRKFSSKEIRQVTKEIQAEYDQSDWHVSSTSGYVKPEKGYLDASEYLANTYGSYSDSY